MRLYLLSIIFLLSGVSALAANRYITGPQKITFRTSPETSGKIIQMFTVNSKVKFVEDLESGWSKVEDSEGQEGYVLTRFLTTEVPYLFRYESLKSKNEKLKEEFNALKEKFTLVSNDLKTVTGQLSTTQANLSQSTQSFEELKLGSSQYVQLKEKYDHLLDQIATKENDVEKLESQVSTTYIFWFVAGAGVLLIGWLIGMTTRKKKGYGSSLILD